MNRQTEQVLVAAAQANPQQFDALYRAFINEIYRFIYYKINSHTIAEDLTSQVFMQALEHLHRFHYQAGARFSSWLYAIARNQVIDYYRRNRPTVALSDVTNLGTTEMISQEVDDHMNRQHLQTILQALPEADQDLIRLRLWEDKSYEEIGTIMQLGPVILRARYSRALKKITKLYRQRYEA